MNHRLEKFARDTLKAELAQLPAEPNHRVFKLMYARGKNNSRSVEDAKAMPINDVIDAMPVDKLDLAMCQVENSFMKRGEPVSSFTITFGA